MKGKEAKSQSVAGSGGEGERESSSSGPPARTCLPIGELLVREGVITNAQLEAALARQKERGGFLGQNLVELRYVTREQLMGFLVKQSKIPHIDLLDYQISADSLGLLPKEVCLRYGVLAIDRLGQILTVAMVDPFDVEALEQVRSCCPTMRIKPILCEWEHFHQVANDLFGKGTEHLEEASLATFGLTEKAAVEPARRPEEARVSADSLVPSPSDSLILATEASAQAKRPWAPRDLHAIVGSITWQVHNVLQEAAQTLARKAVDGKGSVTSLELQEMAAGLRVRVCDVVVRSVSPGAQGRPGTLPDLHELMEAMRDGLRGCIRDALTTFLKEAGEDYLPARELARLMQQVVRDAMQDAAATVGPCVERPSRDLAQVPMPLRQGAEAYNAEIEQSMRQTIETLQKSQADRETRMAELIAAAVQATQAATKAAEAAVKSRDGSASSLERLAKAAQEAAVQAQEEARRAADQAESLAVTDHRRRGLSPGLESTRSKVRAGLPGKSFRDALEARDGPGLRLRVDESIVEALDAETPLAGFTFDSFLVCKDNEFTVKLCRAVAADPGGQYNPLFLYGDVGVGKTHLTNAIGNEVLRRDPKKRVGYVSASRFARRIVDAIEKRILDSLRETYCLFDVLILDDVQFLGGRIEAQEEFFHIFNALHQGGRQVVIVADNPPNRLGQLEKRLVSRFDSGIVAHVKPPDREARIEILRHFAQKNGATISEEVLGSIASRVTSDVRRMTGSLRKVIAFAQMVGQEITGELVEEILTHLDTQEAE